MAVWRSSKLLYAGGWVTVNGVILWGRGSGLPLFGSMGRTLTF